MDIAATDTRVKLLMRSENLSYEETVHLLKVCSWDVSKAQSIIAQRKQCESSMYSGTNQVVKHPVVVPGQGTIKSGADEMEHSSSYSSSNTQVLPKSVNTSTMKNEDMPGPRLQRGMSNAMINSNIVTMARDFLQKDAEAAMTAKRGGDDDDGKSFIQTTEFTFVLPDLSCYPEDFKAFLYKDLIDTSTLVSLEQGGHLNWWADIGVCQRLLPMVTSGDGNCLLHAASLGMWGLHDRQLMLRKLLCDALTNGESAKALKRRWRYQQSISYRQCDLVLSEEEWEEDWKFLLQLSSPQPRCVATRRQSDTLLRFERPFAGQSQETEVIYESLEELHVFVLAHILRRPIIVIAKAILEDVNGDALAPIPFGGIYLPLEWDARQCHSVPLLLTYDLSHFCALVTMEASSTGNDEPSVSLLADALPLVNPQLELLPVHFAIDPGTGYNFSKSLDFSLSHHEKIDLLQNYFVIEQIPIPHIQRDFDSYPESLGASGTVKTELMKSDSEESAGSGRDQNFADDVDKKSIPKPMKFITKSFDSIGSKLKNITKMNKIGKMDRRGSIGIATQSTRTSSIATESCENQSYVVCARLRQRKTGYQDIMVGNYIATMKEKFSAQQVRRREQNAEIRRRSIDRFSLRPTAMVGDNSSYGATLRTEAARLEQGPAAEVSNNSRHSQIFPTSNAGVLQRQDTMVTAGKSKFYTVTVEDQCPKVDPSWESKKSDDPFRKEKGIGNKNAEKGTLKYNKLDTMQLESAQDVTLVRRTGVTEKADLIGWETLPRPAGKVSDLEFEGAPRRTNVTAKRMGSDRHTVGGNSITSKPPESRTTRYITNTLTGPQNPQDSKRSATAGNGPSGVIKHEPNREKDICATEKEQRLLCRAGDCPFYGTYETDFLCSQCFKSGKKSKLCRVANCQNEGDPAQGNLCKLCFQKKHYSFQVQYPTAQTKF